MNFRVGIGRDVHRIENGRTLVLGGVHIRDDLGCVAHSDGDCVVHALMDALLGAAALPNIGVLFPDTELSNGGRNSLEMLAEVVFLVARRGFTVVNCDLVIQLDILRLNPYLGNMRERIAPILGIDGNCIGMKATTAEGIGAVGAGQAIEVFAVCLITANEGNSCG
jgi:2-C-methyl-D-erythritol 2,4-cyclodiphosphate synthase